MIFVVVEVTYDFYRFEKLLFATADRNKLAEFKQQNKPDEAPVYTYANQDSKLAKILDIDETPHWWVKTFRGK